MKTLTDKPTSNRLETGLASEQEVAQGQAQRLGLPFEDLRQTVIAPAMATWLSERHAQRLQAIVLEDHGHALRVGLANPDDVRAHNELSALLRRPMDFVVVTPTHLNRALERLYRRPDQLGQFAREVEREVDGDDTVIDLLAVERSPDASDAPVVKLLQTIFEDAGRVNASDIHIEPAETTLTIRFRIDGRLYVQIQADPRIAPPLMVRLKLMANLDIAERRLPQEGRFCAWKPTGSASTNSCLRLCARRSQGPSISPTASCWSPGPPAVAKRPLCTPRSISSIGPR
jgi:MSHA biogenesis protein MshE